MSNEELGIALNDAKAAQQRLSGKDGFQLQHDWSIRYINQRLISTIAFIGVVAFIMVWSSDTSNLVRYSVTGLLILLSFGFIVAMNRKNAMLEKIRKQQLEEFNHSNKNP